MSILPEGEALRRALKWVSEQRERDPGKSYIRLIDEACLRFDLTPKDGEALIKYTGGDGSADEK